MADHTIVYLSAIVILCNTWYSFVIPFLPLELENKKVDETYFGYIFGAFSIGLILSSLYVPFLYKKFTRKSVLMWGIILMSIPIIGFGLALYMTNATRIVVFWWVLRFIQGVGNAFINWSAYSTVSILYPHNRMTYVIILESMIGVGLALGPLIGTIFYNFEGFEHTFIIVGTLLLIVSIFVPMALKDPQQILEPENNEDLERLLDEEIMPEEKPLSKQSKRSSLVSVQSIGFRDAFSNTIFVMWAIAAFYSQFVYTFQEPILSTRLSDSGLSDVMVGLFYMISAISCTLALVIVPTYVLNYHNQTLISFGLILSGFSMILVGPSHLLPNSVIIMAFGQFIYMFFAIFAMITPLPEMIDQLNHRYKDQEDKVIDMAAAIVNAWFGLGEALGPIFGSYFTYIFDFRTWWDLVGIQLLIFGVIYIFACKYWSEPYEKLKDKIS